MKPAQPLVRQLFFGLLYAVAAVAGWSAGYAFGLRAGGTWVALIAGLNSALFATLMADWAGEQLFARLTQGRREDRP